MIEIDETPDQDRVGRIVLRPNQSLSWQATKLFLGLLLCLSLAIATFFLLQGYWMILPFSLLEMSVVGGCFYYLSRRAQWQQVIDFSPEVICLTAGRKGPEEVYRWQRYFTKIMVSEPERRWYAPRIHLQHRQEEIELGAFLNAEEKNQLVKHLQHFVRLADQRQVVRS